MPEPDAFDPTHALDGWRLPTPAPVQELDLDTLLHPRPQEAKPLLAHAGASGFDPTHLLDGWRPPAPAPLDLELKSMRRAGSVTDEAKRTRLKARGYEMLDVEDVELVEAPATPKGGVEDWVQEIPPAFPSEDAVPAEAAVELPLPDDEVWPLFSEEAQILDAGVETPVPESLVEPQPSIEPESKPIPVELPEAEAEVEPEAAPSVLDAAPAEEKQTAQPERIVADEGVPEPEAPVAPAAAEMPAVEPQPEVERALAAAKSPIETPMLDFQVPPPPAVFGAPVLDFRAAPTPPELDPESVIAGIELPKVTPPPVTVEMPELDIAALTPQPPQLDPRLLAHWQAGAWTALARRVAGASEELLQTPDGLRAESHAPQWLCAVWPPQKEDAPLGRWPELASLVAAETMADALQQLLTELPDEAPLWSADREADWDLVAELVLHQDAQLRPAQAQALRGLAESERHARLARIGAGYALQGRVTRRRA